ncbi:MAG: pyrroloquinoline quinone-dependent dehydrogenase [Balneolales bacterium]
MSILLLVNACREGNNEYSTWKIYKGDAASTSYSELDQINRENVAQLEVAWTFNSGDHDDIDWAYSAGQSNPIIVDGVMYFTTPAIRVIAVDAATGEQIWTFDPFEGKNSSGVNRGVVYWEDGNDKRIFFTAGSFLYALNAETGTLIPDFGHRGAIDQRDGIGRDPGRVSVSSTSPGIIHGDLLIMGSTVGENNGAAPGHIRAYNTRSGNMEWIFHTIPQPGEFGYDTWGESAWLMAGGANNWGGMSLDTEREIVFVPTGSSSPDFFTPGTRGVGDHLFANTLLALDANTGERIWHFQAVPHDLWDYDLPAPANLVTVEKDGNKVDAIAQVTKQGFVFVLDRETGEPIFPIEERPVPQSDIAGEASSPVQLFPSKPDPFVRQNISEETLTDISPEANAYARERFRELNYEGIFTPVGVRNTLFYPGGRGGANWGGASYDPETSMLYINANEIGNIFSLKQIQVPSVNTDNPVLQGEAIFQNNCAACHGTPGSQNHSQFPSLDDAEERFSSPEILEILDDGQGIMPPFTHLSTEDKEALIKYLFTVDKDGNIDIPTQQVGNDSHTNSYAVDTAYQLFLDEDGYPATQPPWGTLNAINLNTGELEWKVPLGEYEELTEKGIPVTGTQNLGGSIVTAGGLVFIAAAEDEKFRAFDKQTGEILWEHTLPAGGHASPSTYQIAGKQYIVIPAAGGSRVGTTKSDAYIVFALPEEDYL